VLIKRTLAVSVLGLALATGALAQTTPTTPAAPTTPTPGAPSSSLAGVRQEHPEWFTSDRRPYFPCPASVQFNDGHSACLGCPTACPKHFRGYKEKSE
jgi:hypothetical protein